MPRVYRQAAVKPHRVHEERVEIALVTSQSGKRLVMLKGSLDNGEVYLTRATGVVDPWTEAGFRLRRFMPVEAALTLLHPVLQGFVNEAARLIRAQGSRPPVSASVARV